MVKVHIEALKKAVLDMEESFKKLATCMNIKDQRFGELMAYPKKYEDVVIEIMPIKDPIVAISPTDKDEPSTDPLISYDRPINITDNEDPTGDEDHIKDPDIKILPIDDVLGIFNG